MAYFLIQFLPLFYNVFSLFSESVSVFYLYTLFFTFSRPVGAILFGLAFWMIARRLRDKSSVVVDYMIISGIGLVLLFVSNQAIIFVDEPYPPFGLASVSFIGKFLDYIISLESLLTREHELKDSITHKFSLRAARLIKKTPQERKSMYKKMKNIYGTRSSISHGSAVKEVELNNVQEIARVIMHSYMQELVRFGCEHEKVIDHTDFG